MADPIILDPTTLNAFFAVLTTLILAIIAFLNWIRTNAIKTSAAVTAENTAATVANTAATVAVISKPALAPAAVIPAAVQPGSPAAAAPASTAFDMGFSVTPTLIYGLKSPSTITFRLTGSQAAVDHPGIESVDIAWDDGSSQNVKLVKGYAEVQHTFMFVAQHPYTGWTFNPVFIINGTDGSRRTFNVDGTSVEIGIET